MTTKYPKISIITPNYNQGDYLEDTILSVLNQNYPNLEYIIIDGGSTDNSVEIIKKYEDRITYWESKPDNGMYDAIEKGFAKSTGDIMAWINSDDMYHQKSFFTVAEIFSNFPQVNWLIGFPSIYDAQGRIVECGHSMRQWSRFDLYVGTYKWIQQESVFWNRSLWERAGGFIDTSLKYGGDFELWNRFFKIEKLYTTTALISGFRMRDGQLSHNQRTAYEAEIEQILATNVLTEAEKKIVKTYHKRRKWFFILARLKIFNAKPLLFQYRAKSFDYPPLIRFNRDKQAFEM